MKYLIILLSLIGVVVFAPGEHIDLAGSMGLADAVVQLQHDFSEYLSGQLRPLNINLGIYCPYLSHPDHLSQNHILGFRLGKRPLSVFVVPAIVLDNGNTNMVLIVNRLDQNFVFHIFTEHKPYNDLIWDFVQFVSIHRYEQDLGKITLDKFQFKTCSLDLLDSLRPGKMLYFHHCLDGHDIGGPLGIITRLCPIFKNKDYVGEYSIYSPHSKTGQAIENSNKSEIVVPVCDSMVLRLKIKDGIEVPECLYGSNCQYHDLLNLKCRDCFEVIEIGIKVSHDGVYTGPKWTNSMPNYLTRETNGLLYELLLVMNRMLSPSFEDVLKNMLDSKGCIIHDFTNEFGITKFEYPESEGGVGLTDVYVDIPVFMPEEGHKDIQAEPEGESMPERSGVSSGASDKI